MTRHLLALAGVTLTLSGGAALAQSAYNGPTASNPRVVASCGVAGLYADALSEVFSQQYRPFTIDTTGRLCDVGTASGGASGGGGAVYGPTQPGVAPAAGTSQQPVLNGFLDAGGLVRSVSPANSLPVSGTVTANLGTIAGAATAANQPTNAAQASTTSGQTGTLGLAAAAAAAPTLTTAQSYPLSLTLASALRVDGSAVIQPISGTVTANLASGANIIGKVGIDQTTPGTTNKVTLGSDTVAVAPTNAATVATAANQTNVTSATGTAPASALGVQSAQGTALATAANQARSAGNVEAVSNAVGASAAVSTTIRAAPTLFAKFNAYVFSTQTATTKLQGCVDNACASSFDIQVVSLAAGVGQTFTTPIMYPYYRIFFQMGATAGNFSAATSYTAS